MIQSSKQTVGQVDFVCSLTGRRITTVPVYESEAFDGLELLERAKRHIRFERLPVGHPTSNPFSEHHLLTATREFFVKTPLGLKASF